MASESENAQMAYGLAVPPVILGELAEHAQSHFDTQQAEARDGSPDTMPSTGSGYMQACQLCDQLTESLHQKEQEIETLRRDNAALQNQLQACRDDLFRLQPSEQVPDSRIAQAWNDLKEEITSWIDAELLRFEQERGQDRSPLEPFSDAGEARATRFIRANPELGGEHLVCSYIHYHLQRGLFDDDIMLFGLGSQRSKMLRSIERNMKELKPREEMGSILTWRSETLLSIAASQEYLQRRENTPDQLARDIFKDLVRFFPVVEGNRASYEAFCDKIVTPAVKLAVIMQTSSTCYRFRPRLQEESFFSDKPFAQGDIPNHKLIDVKTGKTLKSSVRVVIDKNGCIGKGIMCLAPSLGRYSADKSLIKLAREVTLVELNQPPSTRRSLRILQPRCFRKQETTITSEHSDRVQDVDHLAKFTESMPGSFPGGY